MSHGLLSFAVWFSVWKTGYFMFFYLFHLEGGVWDVDEISGKVVTLISLHLCQKLKAHSFCVPRFNIQFNNRYTNLYSNVFY